MKETMHIHKFPPFGVGPSVWGPIFWKTMHIVSLGYSESPSNEEQQAAIQFYESLIHMIPCPICKEHYLQNITKLPVRNAVANRDTLVSWVFTMHNMVNEQLGHPQISFPAYIQSMQRMASENTLRLFEPSWPVALGIGVLLGAGAYTLYQKTK